MGGWGRWIGLGVATGVIILCLPSFRDGHSQAGTLSKAQPAERAVESPVERGRFDGLDLTRLTLEKTRVTTPLPGGQIAELTLDPALQRAALEPMLRHKVPEAGVVMLDVKTGEVLVYASVVNGQPGFDVNARAESPAASVFKVVTGAALIERAGLTAATRQCYHGGRSRISLSELKENPRADTLCTTLDDAMGRSLNVVFARLAMKHLSPAELRETGQAMGFGAPVPFVTDNQPSRIDLPTEPVEFARSAAGFWHTTLSPLAAASMMQGIANAGVALRPRLVREVTKDGASLWRAGGDPSPLRRMMKPETAAELTRMLVKTVASGSARKSFQDRRGRSYLPGVRVAGKTGTLASRDQSRLYTWFVGFAPAEAPRVAIASLVVNSPKWHIKGPQLAREVLEAYFKRER